MNAAEPNYTSLDLPPPPADRPYVLINMVMSADGKAVIEGTERGLGSPADQRLMRELRVNADVVLNGAGTLRASGTSSRIDAEELEALRLERGKSRAPIAAVLSRSGDLPLDRAFFRSDAFDAVVYLSEAAPSQRRTALETTGRRLVIVPAGGEIAAALRHMRREFKANVLLVEGGPTINGELFRLGLVDEYFLTLGGLVVGGERALTAVQWPGATSMEAVQRLELLSAVPNGETGEVYLRYRVRR